MQRSLLLVIAVVIALVVAGYWWFTQFAELSPRTFSTFPREFSPHLGETGAAARGAWARCSLSGSGCR